jgi:signal transduction histidine kinase/ActR/RegA family two-component response regulator
LNDAASDPGGKELRDQLRQDLGEVRLGQARLLLKRTVNSCLIVEGVIVYFTALIAVSGHPGFAALWFALTSTMVAIVFLYSRLFRAGITPENRTRYLRGHMVISGMTGLVWSGLAIAYLDSASTLNLFIAVNIVVSIALGGMLPSAEYRPSWVSLASGMFLPFAVYWLVTVDGPARLIGVGILILYGFGLLVSARSELQTLETLAAERHRRLNEKLREQNRQIEKASAEKSRFLAATSHDMSQPLQAQGFFLRALRDQLTTPEQIELLDKVEADWSSQKNLLQALVETARLSSGAVITRSRIFRLQPVLASLESEFADTARRKSVKLDIARTGLAVESDPLLLTRILRNLIGNAVKFTPAGGQVKVGTRRDGDRVWLEITDTGPGIPADRQAAVFDEYVQLDPGGDPDQKGLGLGLTIVRQLAGVLGLELDFASREGEGTRAAIAVPLRDAALAETTTESPETEFSGAPLVVLVEDEAAVRESLAMLLTQWGCRVLAASGGSEALRLLSWANEAPAMIVADKRLPDGEDGLDVISRVRDEVLEDVPAVLLTGDVYQFEAAGTLDALTIIPKPADSHQLHAALAEAMTPNPG